MISFSGIWKTEKLFRKQNNFLEPSFTSLLKLAYQSNRNSTELPNDHWDSIEMNTVDFEIFLELDSLPFLTIILLEIEKNLLDPSVASLLKLARQ